MVFKSPPPPPGRTANTSPPGRTANTPLPPTFPPRRHAKPPPQLPPSPPRQVLTDSGGLSRIRTGFSRPPAGVHMRKFTAHIFYCFNCIFIVPFIFVVTLSCQSPFFVPR